MPLIKSFVYEWAEIIQMAFICTGQAMLGDDETDCPKCWKCDLARSCVVIGSIVTITCLAAIYV